MKLVCLAASLLATSTPAWADSIPAASDNAEIDSLIQPLFAGFTSGKIKPAIFAFMNHGDLLRAKVPELEYLGVQAEAVVSAYGPIRTCEQVEQKVRGRLAERRLYLCQHEKYMTRWLVDVFKSPTGWQPSNLRFDDKIMNGIDD